MRTGNRHREMLTFHVYFNKTTNNPCFCEEFYAMRYAYKVSVERVKFQRTEVRHKNVSWQQSTGAVFVKDAAVLAVSAIFVSSYWTRFPVIVEVQKLSYRAKLQMSWRRHPSIPPRCIDVWRHCRCNLKVLLPETSALLDMTLYMSNFQPEYRIASS